MPTDSVGAFTETLRRTHLLEALQLIELGRDLQVRFPEPRTLAAELVQRGWLTPYQANQLLQGHGDELLIGSYVLLERIGEGGMGAVFKARNWKLGRVVAVKRIRKDRLDNPDAVRRFHREIRAAAQLDHPNIVRALDADEVAGTHLLVMDYVQGVDLAKLVKQHGPLPADRACDYCRQAALGLQHASERGLVHRDVKPSNLLLTSNGVIKILDMGLARREHTGDGDDSSTMTREGTVMGTLDYIAPEQAMDSHTVDVRADLYSLGCTLYYLLSGRVPFPGGEALEKLMKHRLQEPAPLERLRPGVPAAAVAVARRLMAKRAVDRFQTAAEAAEALAAAARGVAPVAPAAALPAGAAAEAAWSFLDGSSDQADTVAVAPRTARLRLSPWILAGMAVSLALLALGLVGFLLLLPRPAPSTAPPPPREPAPEKQGEDTAFLKWVRETAALPAERQADAVAAELKKRNRGFNGVVTPTIREGVVIGAALASDDVTDLSPLRALPGLTVLICAGSAERKGRLTDLSPLKGLKLSNLDCTDTGVSDLSPLKGMALTNLTIVRTPASDLSPLKDAPLTALNCSQTPVSDLSPLKGMKLTRLDCGDTRASDLSPLEGMPLKFLAFPHTPASDLTPLKGLPLEFLRCDDTRITDFAPLKDIPIKDLNYDFNPRRDAATLRAMRTLRTINGQPAADVLKAGGADPPGL